MVVKNQTDIQGLRRANRLTARLLRELANLAHPGVRTRDLDAYAADYMARLGAEPVFHTEAGFPACINTSVNDAVLHGVPGDYTLQPGDVLSIDAGMLLDGYCGDATITVGIGDITPARRRLIETTHGAMMAGIKAAATGNRVGDISSAMQRYAESRGFGVIRGFTGHGLGHRMHEAPETYRSPAARIPGRCCAKGWSSPSSRFWSRAHRRSPTTPTAGPCAPWTAGGPRSSSTPIIVTPRGGQILSAA